MTMASDFHNQNSNPRSIGIGDFNNDTFLDIVVANSNTNTIGISFGFGNGSFSKQTTYSTGSNSNPYSVAVGDFNNDHQLDIVVANYGTHTIGIFFGYGDGSFDLEMTFFTGVSQPLIIVVGYLNNDQELDLVAASYVTQSVDVLFGQGNGNLALQNSYSTGYDSLPFSIALGDFNSDNRPDIVVANYGTNNIGIFLSYGNTSFTNQTTYLTGYGSRPYSVVVGDFNNDSKLDIIVANSGTGSINLLLGTGRGTFEIPRTFITYTFGPLYIIATDFNQDQILDVIITTSWNSSISIILGDSDTNFVNERIYSYF
jgi:predicted Zn-dependent protease with MMP-like domain